MVCANIDKYASVYHCNKSIDVNPVVVFNHTVYRCGRAHIVAPGHVLDTFGRFFWTRPVLGSTILCNLNIFGIFLCHLVAKFPMPKND